MDKITTQDVYIPVDAIKGAQYFILCKSDLAPINQLLEKKENVYVFTSQELLERDKERDKQIAGDAFTAGRNYECDMSYLNKTEYLNNLKP